MLYIENRYDGKKILLHRDRIQKLLDKRIPIPICVEIDPADGFCNQSCIECNYGSNVNRKLRLIDENLLNNVIAELAENGVLAIEWVGGSEPTLHPKLSSFIATSKEYGLRSGLISNGVLLWRIFDNLTMNDLEYVRISMDAASASVYEIVHGCNYDHFEKVIKNIENALTMGISSKVLGISFRIMKENMHEIAQAAELVKKLGVCYIQYKYSLVKNSTTFLQGIDQVIQNEIIKAKEFEDENFSILGGYKKISSTLPCEELYSGCISSPLVGVITAGGEIPFCIRYRNNPSFHIGNIKNGFMKAWLNTKHEEMLKKARETNCVYICKHHRYNTILAQHCSDGIVPIVGIKENTEINSYFV